MKETIKLNFVDFVSNFDSKDNYFYRLLSKKYEVRISDNPDFIFCSNYGTDKFKNNCVKIYYTGENQRPSFGEYDFVMSFDFLPENNRHYRLPLYALYIDLAENNRKEGRIFNKFSQSETIMQSLCRTISEDDARKIWRSKSKFCCMLNSNPSAEFRVKLFKELSKYKKVDSGGKAFNNIGYTVSDKMDFIKDYRFVFAMENSSHSGYTTEKIVEPFFVNSIPLYWGNPNIDKDFNIKAFVNYNQNQSIEQFVDTIIELDTNEEKAIEMIRQPKFINGMPNNYVFEENVLGFLTKIIDNLNTIKPVSKTVKGKYLNYKHLFFYIRGETSYKLKTIVKRYL